MLKNVTGVIAIYLVLFVLTFNTAFADESKCRCTLQCLGIFIECGSTAGEACAEDKNIKQCIGDALKLCSNNFKSCCKDSIKGVD